MKHIVIGITMVVMLYLALCAAAWKMRNPLGNDWTFWIYFPAPLTFERIPQLQVTS